MSARNFFTSTFLLVARIVEKRPVLSEAKVPALSTPMSAIAQTRLCTQRSLAEVEGIVFITPHSHKKIYPNYQREAMTEIASATLLGTVERVIKSPVPNEPEKAQIDVEGMDYKHKSIRI